MEYDHWVTLGRDLPEELCQLDGVNIEDESQVDELLGRYSQGIKERWISTYRK